MFGPVVCAKLAADFDEWDSNTRSRSDDRFYEFYCKLRECFSWPVGKSALVTYPTPWFNERGIPIFEPKLEADLNRVWWP